LTYFSDIEDFSSAQPPGSLVPRLHAIASRKLGNSELFIASKDVPSAVQLLKQDVVQLRTNLISTIALAFGGDTLVAEYVLLSILVFSSTF
jgi:hypothetical protein